MGFFSKDKAGKDGHGTTGGSSTGSGGRKRGGNSNSANPHTEIDQGLLTCGTCGGGGTVGIPRYESVSYTDDNGKIVETERFAGEDVVKCGPCGGSGKVKKKK